MFNRTRNQSGQQSDIASAFDDVLAELGSRDADTTDEPEEGTDAADATDEAPEAEEAPTADDDTEEADIDESPAPGRKPVGKASAADRILEHAETLRATRDAQQQAQELLAQAATARGEATDQAEQIVLEAKAAADEVRAAADDEAESTRREAVEWVTEQRSRVESATALLTRNAERDAENIRTEAMRSAMLEAEQTARLYVGEAAARGARDAEEIRGTAREVLHRAADLGSDLRSTMADLVRALEVATDAVTDQLHAIDALLDEAKETTTPTPAAEADDDREPSTEATGTAANPDEPDDADDADPEAGHGRKQLGSLFREQNG